MDEVKQTLDKVLAQFGMHVEPEMHRKALTRWVVVLDKSLIQPSTWFVQNVAVISKDLRSFNVNVDGPRTSMECIAIVDALQKELGHAMSQEYQWSSQGGR